MKKVHHSKTIWFNILTAIVATANELIAIMPQLEEAVPVEWAPYTGAVRGILLIVSTLGNLWLRFLTDKGITL